MENKDLISDGKDNRNSKIDTKLLQRKHDDTAVFRRGSGYLYACDQDHIRHMYPRGSSDYLIRWEEAADKLFREGKYYNPRQVVDIYSRGSATEQALSNFYKIDSWLEIDGVRIRSMEGFIQSLKTPNVELQKSICVLVGKDAWQAGHLIEDFDGVSLYWNGIRYNRYSDEYMKLLEHAYEARFLEDSNFREAIETSVGKKLIHTIGTNDKKKTVLTADEFVRLLENMCENLEELKRKFFTYLGTCSEIPGSYECSHCHRPCSYYDRLY